MPLAPLARHLFTTRDLAPGPGAEADDAWQHVAAFLDLPVASVWRAHQVHGCHTLVIDGERSQPEGLPEADALVSDRDDLALVVKVADCVPILLADRTGRGVGAVHAGWRGTAQRIAASAVDTMTRSFGIPPSDLVAAIGPSIGPCCYEVGPEVHAELVASAAGEPARATAASWFSAGDGDRFHLDLWRANRDQLIAAGVPASSVHVAGLCTVCHFGRFFSYRRERARAGRMLAAIRRVG